MSTKENKKISVAKVFSVIGKVLLWLLIASLVFVACTLAFDKFIKKSSIPSFFGKSVLVIATPSMSDAIEAGDMIVIEKSNDYAVGDIVTYFPAAETVSVTHRIVRIEGEKFYTKGDANDSEDPDPVFASQIVGKVVGHLPKVGIVVEWLRTPQGIAFLIAICAVVVALVMVADSPDKAYEPQGKDSDDGDDTTSPTATTEVDSDK